MRAIPRILALSALGLWLVLVTLAVTLEITGVIDAGDETFLSPLSGGFALAGALVAVRQPRNALGWMMLAIALVLVSNTILAGYVEPVADPRERFAGTAALSYYTWNEAIWIPLVGIFVPLLFPNGHVPSRRWRPVAWLGLGAVVLGIVGKAFARGEFDAEWPGVENPLGIGGAAGTVIEAADVLSGILLLPGAVAAGASVVVRLRRSRGQERQQLKWFAYAAGLLGGALLVAGTAALADEIGAEVTTWTDFAGAVAWHTAVGVILIGFPVAIALAVFRYRLYDIDVVINRTLVYGSVTALLVGTYVGLVLLLQVALRPLTKENGLAIALSTLGVAALFRPARNRIQALVDRRFYRRKYDAERTLHGFAARLRDEVDLEALRGELTAVVTETMQPAHVSLWLREGGR